jgi:hypothetical protein
MGNELSDIVVNYISENQWTFDDDLPSSLTYLQNNETQNKNNALLASYRLFLRCFIIV